MIWNGIVCKWTPQDKRILIENNDLENTYLWTLMKILSSVVMNDAANNKLIGHYFSSPKPAAIFNWTFWVTKIGVGLQPWKYRVIFSPGHDDDMQCVLSLKICSAPGGVINDARAITNWMGGVAGGLHRKRLIERFSSWTLAFYPRRPEVNVLKRYFCFYMKGRTGEHSNKLEVVRHHIKCF